jgi:hypothetical protein
MHHITRSLAGMPFRRCLLAAAIAALASGQAVAVGFDVNDDVKGIWNTTVSLGASAGLDTPDRNWIGITNGGTATFGSFDDPRLNFGKGKVFSSSLKVLSDLELKYRDKYGLFMRAKAWTDPTLENYKAPHGHVPNGYSPNSKLDDSGFTREGKFTGASLLDAYVYGNFELDNGMRGGARLGNQVLNWGESLFYPGVNQTNPVDVSAFKRAGATVKEGLLPVPLVHGSLSTGGITLEAYYQLKHKPFSTPGCGTFYSRGDLGLEQPSCNRLTLDGNFYPGGATGDALDINFFSATRTADRKPKDSGQYGLAARGFVEALDGEVGAYFVNEHAKLPVFTYTYGAGAGAPFNYFFDYNIPNIKHLALTYSTTIKGWSASFEVGRHQGLPAAINSDDVTRAVLAGAFGPGGTPAGSMGSVIRPLVVDFSAGFPVPTGPSPAVTLGQGTMYDRINKTQFQGSAMRVFDRVMGADQLFIMAEAVFQQHSGMVAGRRYGRSSPFGMVPQAGETCAQVNPVAAANRPSNCDAEGFLTKNAFGYQVLAEWTFTDAIGPVRLKPQISFKHDVKGYSLDGFVIEGTKQLGLALRAEYLNKYFGVISMTRNNYNRFDPDHDRDAVSLVFGASF